ncbi:MULTISPECIES: SWIM zinc finger family protein [unclassified Nonomuraea]|uniref:SWIM zinc finger family protein n=1 Tax=unclassified Nonomuraea TaxID=2593643 RepID=UPI00340B2FC1
MIERWSRDQVLALAPDAPSRKAAQGVAKAAAWPLLGVVTDGAAVVFGECAGSGAKPYQTCVDLGEPAYRCGCPSRKFPCKHALGLLLLWAAGEVPAAAAAPEWAADWLADRATRPTSDVAPTAGPGSAAGPGAGPGDAAGPGEVAGPGDAAGPEEAAGPGEMVRGAEASAGRGGGRGTAAESARHARVTAGLAELERWLTDQIRQGLAAAGDGDWDDLAKRLVDAQAPGMAGTVSRLRAARAADDWPERLLEEYALIDLLAVAYRRRAHLPAPLAQTVLSRVGFQVTREEVLAGPTVRDDWDVLGQRDEVQERLTSRRVWLRGRDTGRPALVLSFAPQGHALDASLATGATVHADLAFYPGAAPLRALLTARHTPPPPAPVSGTAAPATAGTASPMGVPPGVAPEEAMDEVAKALAADPWTDSWPLVLAGVVPGRTHLGGFPLHRSAYDPWRLMAVSGGHPVTVAAEWTPYGLRPLTTWADDGTVVIL